MRLRSPYSWLVASTLCWSTVTLAYNTSLHQLPLRTVNSFTEVFTEGQPALTLQARIEYMDEATKARGQANTLNTKLSFASGNFQGFAGLIEFNNTATYFSGRHNAGIDPLNTRPIIADPKGSSVLRSFIQITGIDETIINLGRQYITLDNQRFIGNNTLRQTPQSFDALSIHHTSIKNTELFYAYLAEINNNLAGNTRISGQEKTRTHLLNASWKPWDFIAGTAFGYLSDNLSQQSHSYNTYGLRLAGDHIFNDSFSLGYAADGALQYGHNNNPARGATHYRSIESALHYTANDAMIDGISLNIGQEHFGSRSHTLLHAFQTPLGSNDSFNGLAGVFITKPSSGLEDNYLSVTGKWAHAYEACLSMHQFKATNQAQRYGQEWDGKLGYRWNEYFLSSILYSHFKADPASTYRDRHLLLLSATISI